MRPIATNLNESNRMAHPNGLLVGPIIGLVILQAQIGSAAGLPPAVPSPNGLPWVQTFSDDFTGPQRNSQRLDNDARHRQPIRFNRLGQ